MVADLAPAAPSAPDNTSAPQVGWEEAINNHHFELVLSSATGDFSFFTSRRLQDATSGIDHAAILSAAAPPEVSQEIGQSLTRINVDAVNAQQTSFDSVSTTIQGISKDPNAANNVDDWEKKIDDDAASQTKAAAAAIESARKKAIDTIKAAPPEARPAAANLYIKGSQIVAGVVQTFTNAIGNVVSKVADFVKGIFSSLNNAVNTVKNAAGSAISTIGGFFGGLFDVTPDTAPASAGAPAPANDAPSSTVSYTGLVNWPASTKLSTAALGLDYIQNYLAANGYVTSDEDLKKDDSTIAGKTVFGPKSGKKHPTLAQLKKVWDDCVSQLGSDGHFIPPVSLTGLARPPPQTLRQWD
jgi:hypothetical protein